MGNMTLTTSWLGTLLTMDNKEIVCFCQKILKILEMLADTIQSFQVLMKRVETINGRLILEAMPRNFTLT